MLLVWPLLGVSLLAFFMLKRFPCYTKSRVAVPAPSNNNIIIIGQTSGFFSWLFHSVIFAILSFSACLHLG